MLDTDVVSRLAPGREAVDPEFSAWLLRRGDELFLSAVTVAEIERGIAKLQRAGAVHRVRGLRSWLEGIVTVYADRILSFDVVVARSAGALNDAARAQGRDPGFPDIAIAATAQVHDLRLLTFNARHFEPLGIAFSRASEIVAHLRGKGDVVLTTDEIISLTRD
jgi:hypothetical protein